MNSTVTPSFGGSPQLCLAVSIRYIQITTAIVVTCALSCMLDVVGILAAIPGNFVVILAISRNVFLKGNAEFVLLCLAISDLFVSGLVQPLMLVTKIQTLLQRPSCTTANLTSTVVPIIFSASLASEMLVSVDRTVAVMAPYWYEKWVTPARLITPALCLWFMMTLVKLASLFASIPLRTAKLLTGGSATICLLVTVVCYGLLIKIARRHESQVQVQQQQLQLSVQERKKQKRERKALWTAIYVNGVYFAGYVPTVLVIIITVVTPPSEQISFLLRSWSGTLACCIAAVNPVILSWKNPRVGRQMKRILGIGNASNEAAVHV